MLLSFVFFARRSVAQVYRRQQEESSVTSIRKAVKYLASSSVAVPLIACANPIMSCAGLFGSLPSTMEKRIEFLAGRRIGEAIELALFGDQLGSPHEAAPGRARQRSTDADPPHAESRDLRHGEISRPSHQQIDRLRRHAGNHGADVFGCTDTGCIQAVGTRVRVGFEPMYRLSDVG